MSILTVETRITHRYLMGKSKSELAFWYLELLGNYESLQREAACPCCRSGVDIEGNPCEECKGKALASVAYDTCRVHFKLLEEDCEKAIANLNRFARCTIGQPTPDDIEWARKWLKDHGESEY